MTPRIPEEQTMEHRIDNPALAVPGALGALRELAAAVKHRDIPDERATLAQISGEWVSQWIAPLTAPSQAA
jgi:hypothetical protein